MGVGASSKEQAYVYLIQDYLHKHCRPIRLINPAKSGATLKDIVSTQLPLALETKPDIVSVWTGVNDIVAGVPEDSFQNDLEYLLSSLRLHGNPMIFIATIPDLQQLPRFKKESDPDVTKKRIERFNQIIITLSTRYQATRINLHRIAIEESLISDDGFHPGDKGYRYIADSFLQSMQPVVCKEK